MCFVVMFHGLLFDYEKFVKQAFSNNDVTILLLKPQKHLQFCFLFEICIVCSTRSLRDSTHSQQP